MAGQKATKNIVITTSSFNANAVTYVEGLHQKVILIDGARLAELMIEHGIGVSTSQVFRVCKLDGDYFAG